MADQDPIEESGRSAGKLGLVGGVVVAAMAVYVAVSSHFGHHDAGDTSSSATPPSVSVPNPAAASSAAPKSAAESLCGLKGSSATSLNDAPADVTWALSGTIAVPASKAAGPGVIEKSGVRYCYARSPEGALLAAANVFSWAQARTDDPTSPVVHDVAEGPGYQQLLAAAKQMGRDQTAATSTLQIRGFRVEAYTPDDALIDIACQLDMSGYLHREIEVVWQRGDWRVRVAPDGSLATPEVIDDLAGYVSWMGA